MMLARSRLAYCGSGFGPLRTCANNIVARQYHQVIAIGKDQQACRPADSANYVKHGVVWPTNDRTPAGSFVAIGQTSGSGNALTTAFALWVLPLVTALNVLLRKARRFIMSAFPHEGLV
jgi:hypothetical protein